MGTDLCLFSVISFRSGRGSWKRRCRARVNETGNSVLRRVLLFFVVVLGDSLWHPDKRKGSRTFSRGTNDLVQDFFNGDISSDCE